MSPLLIGIDLVAISLLVFALFLPRHRRRDLVVAFVVVNVGVLAVTSALSATTVTAGLGLGLFGVLSIIRLRSEELTQTEIGYYFAALTLGLLAGLGGAQLPWMAGLMALVLVVVAVADSPRLTRSTRRQDVVLDRAHLTVDGARAHVERLLGTDVLDLAIVRTDLVNDTTAVTVRLHTPRKGDHALTSTSEPVPAEARARR